MLPCAPAWNSVWPYSAFEIADRIATLAARLEPLQVRLTIVVPRAANRVRERICTGFGIVEVPIVFTDRVHGHSKLTLTIAAEELAFVSWWGVRDRVLRRRAR